MPYMDEAQDQALVNTIGLINDRPCVNKENMKSSDYAVKAAAADEDKKESSENMDLSTTSESTVGAERKSRPPTPPTRPESPNKLTPSRFQPYIPPPNFGAVTDHLVFRSAFPQERNLTFLNDLAIKTMLVFVDTEPSEPYAKYITDNAINRIRIDISPNKDGAVKTSIASICDALLVVLDASHYPLHIHCNQGRHRTGCVIACLRRVQGWPLEAVLAEYDAYASPKSRPGDVKFISEVFQPDALVEHAKQHGRFEHRPSLTQLLRSNLVSLEHFVALLSSPDGIKASNASLKSEESKPDSGVEFPSVDPALLLAADGGVGARAQDSVQEAEVSVMECDPMSPPPETAEKESFFQRF